MTDLPERIWSHRYYKNEGGFWDEKVPGYKPYRGVEYIRADLVPQWRPIKQDSLPRSGVPVLVWARWGWEDMDEDSADDEYSARISTWSGGCFTSITSNPYYDVAYDPTHWMPLAEPPTPSRPGPP